MQFCVGAQVSANAGYHFPGFLEEVEIDVGDAHGCGVVFTQLTEEAVVGVGEFFFNFIAMSPECRNGFGRVVIYHPNGAVE